jgi:hypothetical protein
MSEADAVWHRSRVAALQRLAGELLGATSPAAIGELVVTRAAEILGAEGDHGRRDEPAGGGDERA